MKGRILICVLTAALLAGCSGETWTSPLAKAAGLEDDALLLTVDGREVTAWQYLYWLAKDCALLEKQHAESDASPDLNAAKEAALEDTILCATVKSWAEAYDCDLAEAEWEALPVDIQPYLSEYQSRSLAALSSAYGRLYTLCRTAGSPLAPAEGELELFQQEQGLIAAEQILIPYHGDRENARQEAESLFARINGAAEPAATFTSLLEETDGGQMTAANRDETLLSAVAALEPGQISGILETRDGFSILRRLPSDQESLWEAYFENLLSTAAANSEVRVSAAYESLDPVSFWSALQKADDQG